MAIISHIRRQYSTTTPPPHFILRQMLHRHPTSHPRASAITTRTYTDPNSHVVDSDAIANLQAVAAGCCSKPFKAFIAPRPRRCCLNPTEIEHLPTLASTQLYLPRQLIVFWCYGFTFTSAVVQMLVILDNQLRYHLQFTCRLMMWLSLSDNQEY